MRSPFYQANFCAECGNPVDERFSLRPRYLCDECAARLRQRRNLTPLAVLLLAGSLAVFAFSYKRNDGQSEPNHPVPYTSPVSAQDSIVNRELKPQAKPEARVFCGARTKRGTPCKHRVQPGQRCAQHRGMPSLLDGDDKQDRD